jgi:hypothetical protein
LRKRRRAEAARRQGKRAPEPKAESDVGVRAPENPDDVAVLKSRLGEARERYLRLELEAKRQGEQRELSLYVEFLTGMVTSYKYSPRYDFSFSAAAR